MVLLVATLTLILGSLCTPSYGTALADVNYLNHTLNQAQDTGTPAVFMMILLNNLPLCLLMFIPLIGAGLGLLIIFETGVGLGEISLVQGQPLSLSLYNTIVDPVFWIEFAAYSIAMAASLWLFRRLLQGRWQELENTCKAIAASALILLVGAVVETLMLAGFL
jgi:uncharacterized membrane protein SpoIIM required for sporulation